MKRQRVGLRKCFAINAENSDNGGNAFTDVVLVAYFTIWYWIAGIPESQIPPEAVPEDR